ncbi:MAG: polyphosphate kinase 1, partial [Planctomycetia bacterium]
ADQYRCHRDELEPALAAEGIRCIRPGEVAERHRPFLDQLCENELSSFFSPLAAALDRPAPPLVGLSLNLCIRLSRVDGENVVERFVLLPFGRPALRFVTLPAGTGTGYEYMYLEDVVGLFAHRFFPGEQLLECVPFRIIRNADLGVREDSAADLMAGMKEVLDERKKSDCVRLEIAESASNESIKFLGALFEVADDDVYTAAGPLDLSAFFRLADLPGFDALKYEPWPARPAPPSDPRDRLFDVLARRDVLLHHPYESFEPVVRLVEEAADDPDVVAIKQILYRTSRDSPIVAALARAARNGKYVTVIVELKARFDEARNIEWARNLEKAQVQVLYGVRGLKTHAKMCMVVRREPQGIQRYIHLGTGNYNEATARLYGDVSLMTANDEIGLDVVRFFNAITGNSQPQRYRKIEAAPFGLREKLLELIEIETQHGKKGRITVKVNSLVDPKLIEALYAASNAGVHVKLNVRGVCCLRPGVKGMSENITVVSVVDRILEHARILHFHHGGDERVFISSADWMPRNLDRRVELLAPVEDAACRDRLVALLKVYFQDNVKARRLTANGSYERATPNGHKPIRCQELLYRQAADAIQSVEQSRRTVFEPHRAAGAPE